MKTHVQSVEVAGVEIGGAEFVVMAGPCAVECESQLLRTADAVARCGARVLRGGAFKPRTSPYCFQGLGEYGLKLLAKARRATGLRIVTEAMSDTQVELVATYADMIQIGSRSMENQALLQAAARSGLPILLKRGMTATVEEVAVAVEILYAHRCPGVVICERGIRTFGTATRNTCDIAAVPLLRHLAGVPVILDPSHASGRRALVPILARAGVAVEADGLLVEVHPEPDRALSDGEQSISFEQFDAMMMDLQPRLKLWRRDRMVVSEARV